MSADTPLTCFVEGDELVIRIGITTLAFAFEESEQNNPYDEEANAWRRTLKVVDAVQFAADVVREIEDEGYGDGQTPLHQFLDRMCLAAADQGSLGIEEIGQTKNMERGAD